jgi:uncharacterized protein YndB with AHSA1/START domain
MLRMILLGVLAVLLLAVAFIASRPSSFAIERSAIIAARPEAVFPLLNDFHQWGRWSPYEKRDPNMKRSFDGPASGVGSSYAWSGNADAGEGRMEIVEATPGKSVTIDLEFTKPFRAKNQSSFTLFPLEGGGTRVKWSMKGENGFLGKAMSLALDMDALVGKDFEQGLANLDKAARSPG